MNPRNLECSVAPETAYVPETLRIEIGHRTGLNPSDSWNYRVNKRSLDARRGKVKVHLDLTISDSSDDLALLHNTYSWGNVNRKKQVIIIGAGPAGLFAALRLIEHGIKPIIIERGKDVRARRRSLADITRKHLVDPDSNYCFGEGGAGTYSDGKLYTRSTKRGDVRRVLEILHLHGAREEILFDAHPHIGTNKLPLLVTALRERILASGGEIHFDERMVEIHTEGGSIKGMTTQSGKTIHAQNLILATGHSARDIFELFAAKGWALEAKPFAMGIRIEHPQELINEIQYRELAKHPWLPSASYSIVAQTFHNQKQRGVFSFCMCPGGFIVPAATAPGEVVVNGMSPSRRDGLFANSGIVAAIEEGDWDAYADHGPLAGLRMQQDLERSAGEWAKGTQKAPAQRLVDFLDKRPSDSLPETSYIPGLESVPLHELLPQWLSTRLDTAFRKWGNHLSGYVSEDAVITGVESRTSSPVRIPRDKVTLEHTQIKGLYPTGEGAGYAGGIVSAALDGERVADAIAKVNQTE